MSQQYHYHVESSYAFQANYMGEGMLTDLVDTLLRFELLCEKAHNHKHELIRYKKVVGEDNTYQLDKVMFLHKKWSKIETFS